MISVSLFARRRLAETSGRRAPDNTVDLFPTNFLLVNDFEVAVGHWAGLIATRVGVIQMYVERHEAS